MSRITFLGKGGTFLSVYRSFNAVSRELKPESSFKVIEEPMMMSSRNVVAPFKRNFCRSSALNASERLDDIYLKNKYKKAKDNKRSWQDYHNCPTNDLKRKVTERDIKKHGSPIVIKMPKVDASTGSEKKVAEKSPMCLKVRPEVPMIPNIKQSIAKSLSHPYREVDKTHFDDKVYLKMPTETSVNVFPFKVGNYVNEKHARLDDTHFKSRKTDSASNSSFVDYYKDMTVKSKLANIRTKVPGYSEKHLSWYSFETPDFTKSKPAFQKGSNRSNSMTSLKKNSNSNMKNQQLSVKSQKGYNFSKFWLK